MDDDFDVIVIGAGLAGLTAAQCATRAGQRVVVLDGQVPGGRARSDVQDCFVLNRGPHALYLGGAARRVLGELGIDPPGRPPTDRVFGSYGDRLARLPANPRTLLSSRLLGWRGKRAIAGLLRSLPSLCAADAASISESEWLDSLHLPADARRLVEMLVRVATYANAPDALSAEVAIGQLQLALGAGVRYLDGGWQSMVDALTVGLDVRRVQALGFDRTRSTPTVVTADGELRAAAVIVAVGTPRATAALLQREAYDVAGPIEMACLDLAVDGISEPPALFGIDEPLYLSTQTPTDLAPAGASVVHVGRYLPPGDPLDHASSRANLEHHARRAGLSPEVIHSARYLHRMTVVGALPTAAAGGLAGRPHVTASGMGNVFIAGDWVGGVGHLADASLASAQEAARLACRCAAMSG